jgi:hypothetical protein
MSRHRFLLIGALAGLVACTGRDETNTLTAPTGVRPSASVAASAAVAADEVVSLPEHAPPVCEGYLEHRNEFKKQLAENPSDEDLQDNLAGVNAFLNANCR